MSESRFETFFEALDHFALVAPDRQALVEAPSGATVSFGELKSRVDSLAEHLGGVLGPGEFVVGLLPRSVALVELVLSASRVGAACLPIFAPRDAAAAIETARERLAPSLFVYSADRPGDTRYARAGEVWLTLDAIQALARRPVTHRPRPEDCFYVNETSGSSQRPKAVLASHSELIANTEACVEAFELSTNDCHLSTFSSHAHELFVRGLFTGATSVLFPAPVQDASAELLESLARFGVTHLMATPALLALLGAFTERIPKGLRLRVAETGGAPASEQLRETVLRAFGAKLLPVFGATEVGGVALAPPLGEVPRPYSVGRPLPGYEVEVVRDDGAPAVPWEDGELILRGPAIARRYVGAVGLADEGRLTSDGFRTGDVVRRDVDGWIYVRGRISSQFKVGGVSVQAEAIEGALMRHPSVRSAMTLPVHHSMLGYVPAALVVADLPKIPTLRRSRAKFIREMLRSTARHLEAVYFETPRYIKFVTEIPTLGGGKVNRAVARRLYFDEPPRPIPARLGASWELKNAMTLISWRSAWKLFLRRPAGFGRVIRRLVGRNKAH